MGQTHHAMVQPTGKKPSRRPLPGISRRMLKTTLIQGAARQRIPPKNISEPVWEKPVLFGGVFETPEIQASIVPGILGEYCKAVAERHKAEAMSVAMALATVAPVFRNGLRLRLRHTRSRNAYGRSSEVIPGRVNQPSLKG